MLSITNLLDKNERYSIEPLRTMGDILIMLNRRHKLDPFILNELRAMGRSCIRKIGKNDLYEQALVFIARVFSKIGADIEAGITEQNKKVYVEAYHQTESLQRWLEDSKLDSKKRDEMKGVIADTLSGFLVYKETKESIEKEAAEWPTLGD
jgi:hypothetical protein